MWLGCYLISFVVDGCLRACLFCSFINCLLFGCVANLMLSGVLTLTEFWFVFYCLCDWLAYLRVCLGCWFASSSGLYLVAFACFWLFCFA